MELGTLVKLKDGRLGIITSGQYYGTYGISNFWNGKIIDSEGNMTNEKFCGYDNGCDWVKVKDKYTVKTKINLI
jgi:uncharacterized protein involved in tellurium resistance